VTRCRSTQGRTQRLILTSNRASREPDRPPPERIAGDGKALFITDAQASCRCNCVASKSAPFFQTVRVMLAIFRARVRRAIVGRISFSRVAGPVDQSHPTSVATSPIIAPSTAPPSFQRSARFAYRMIFELVIVNIFGSRGTAQSSRSAQFTEHRWSHAAQPKSGTTALRPGQACRYIDRVA
jgi:hypothetical protein